MRQIIGIVFLQKFKGFGEIRSQTQIGGLGGKHFFNKFQSRFHSPFSRAAFARITIIHRQKFAQRTRGSPARQTIIAVVKHAARLQMLPRNFHNVTAIFRADPSPNSVQADCIKCRQILALWKFLETVFKKFRIGSRRLDKFFCLRGVRRIKIRAEKFPRRRRRMNIRRNSLPESKFAMATFSRNFGRDNSFQQKTPAHKNGRKFAIIAVSVSRLREISFVPTVHLLSVTENLYFILKNFLNQI